jgi:hypothetical protein
VDLPSPWRSTAEVTAADVPARPRRFVVERRERVAAWVVGGAIALQSAAACTAGEDITVENSADVTVTVRLGAHDVGEITSGGGVILLEATDCYDGPIVVTYADRSTVEIDSRICPGQTLVVDRSTATLRGRTTAG